VTSNRVDAYLAGKVAKLRAIEPSDYPWIRRGETASPIAFRWRLGGQQVPPEHFAESRWTGVLAAFVFEGNETNSCRGVVSAYAADPRHGFCYVAAARLEDSASAFVDAAVSVDAVILFIDFVLQGWSFRKIYLECAEYNQPQFASLLERCDHEAELRDHTRHWSESTTAPSCAATCRGLLPARRAMAQAAPR